MKTLQIQTIDMIASELANIPEKYQQNFNSTHEGLAVIQEEFEELKHEVFFGKKECRNKFKGDLAGEHWIDEQTNKLHKDRMREEAIQIAAMCVRFIQELT